MKRTSFAVVVVTLAAGWASAQFVQQGNKLVGAEAAGRSRQGMSVAVSSDGNTALVGGPEDGANAGAVWVFTRAAGVWTQQGPKLVGADAVGGAAKLGWSVALSADGTTAIIGGPGDDGGTGAAWVFTRSAGVWTQQGGKLVGTGSAGRPDQGSSVALSADGNTVIVGGPRDDGATGAVWVFTRSAGLWTQQGPKLVGSGAVHGSYWGGEVLQGASVALSADGATAIVGGLGDNDSGAAWVFTRSNGVWSQQGAKLVGSGAAGNALQGISVGVSADGNTAIVGGSEDDGNIGAAWVFTRADGVWSQQGDKLVGSGVVRPDPFGMETDMSVALSGDGMTAVLGRPLHSSDTGAAWVFTRSSGAWTQLGEPLVGTDAGEKARQGASVALSGDGTIAIVGGLDDSNGLGATWVFTCGTSSWVPVVAHTEGKNASQWRSDVGLLNPGTGTANVTLTFHGPDGLVTNTTYVPAGAQSVLVDVVAQLGASGQGALEVSSDRSLKVTSRTYHQASADAACDANGTKGQSYPSLAAGEGLSLGQSAWLPHLAESATYRTNIGLVNTSAAAAVATVELYDGAGSLLANYTVSLAPGEWRQETQPFNSKSAQTALDRGFAKVTVTSGAGVVAFASVIDNLTNDPTTITMQR